MDEMIITSECLALLRIHPTNRGNDWLKALLQILESCPLAIPKVEISHSEKCLPHLHVQISEKINPGKVLLKDDIKRGLLSFGCGIKITNDYGATLRYGDLVQLALTGSLLPSPPDKKWGIPEKKELEVGVPASGKIAFGATTLEKIPEAILPKETQETIEGFLLKVTDKPMRIGLLHSPLLETKSLVILTKEKIQPTSVELARYAHWHTPRHYTWTVLEKHEEEENLDTP